MMIPHIFGHSWKFIVGVLLLLANQPTGWAGAALCAYAARKSGKKSYYAYGTAIYALSWVMVFLGIVLVGSEGALFTKKLMRTHWWQLLTGAIVIAGVVVYVRRKRKKAARAVVRGQTE